MFIVVVFVYKFIEENSCYWVRLRTLCIPSLTKDQQIFQMHSKDSALIRFDYTFIEFSIKFDEDF